MCPSISGPAIRISRGTRGRRIAIGTQKLPRSAQHERWCERTTAVTAPLTASNSVDNWGRLPPPAGPRSKSQVLNCGWHLGLRWQRPKASHDHDRRQQSDPLGDVVPHGIRDLVPARTSCGTPTTNMQTTRQHLEVRQQGMKWNLS